MTERVRQEMTVDAPAERLWAVLTDFDAYPSWAADLKEVEVVERDEAGSPVLVRYRAAAFGRSSTYTLRYDLSAGPSSLPWTLESGDITRVLDGSYELEAVPGEPDRTHVTYHLAVDLVVPLPGFVKRRAALKIVHTALRELRACVEAG